MPRRRAEPASTVAVDAVDFRKRHGISRRQLAAMVGMTHQAVSYTEQPGRKVSRQVELLLHLADNIPAALKELQRLAGRQLEEENRRERERRARERLARRTRPRPNEEAA